MQREEQDVIVKSAAGRTVAVPARQGRARPKVTDQEVIVVELPLSAPPGTAWKAIFEEKIRAAKPAGVGWVHVDTDLENSMFAVTFKLDARDEMLAAIDAIDVVVAATTDEWVTVPEVAEKIAKQERIDQLQAFLDRVIRA